MSKETLNPLYRSARHAVQIAVTSLVAATIAVCSSCTPSKPAVEDITLYPVSASLEVAQTQGNTDNSQLFTAVVRCIEYYQKRAERTFAFGDRRYTGEQLRSFYSSLLSKAQNSSDLSFLTNYAQPFSTKDNSVLVTGYYEPILNGSKTKTERFKYPIYRQPDDLVSVKLEQFFPEQLPEGLPRALTGRITKDKQVVPYFSREEIDFSHSLDDKKLEILWVDDQIALFFLQIQGSGVVKLSDGTEIQVGFDGQNGKKYRAIGALLSSEGKIPKEELSMQSISAYLAAHPEELPRILSYNESYVFFAKKTGGPYGNTGVTLTPFRSIATDHKVFPPCTLAYLETTQPLFTPAGVKSGEIPMKLLVLNQDTGGAIKGAHRVDLFVGKGVEAGILAGNMKQPGKLTLLAPK